jgi:hypothetical protein
MADNRERPEPGQPEPPRKRVRKGLEIAGISATLVLSAASIYQSYGKHINTTLLAVIGSVVVAVIITLVGFFARTK